MTTLYAAGRLLLAAVCAMNCAGAAEVKIPLIHTTDLFHPPMDPDDHIDLATVFALDEFDLRAVLLDWALPGGAGQEAAREPGFVPVAQLCYLTGRAVAVAAGQARPLKTPQDPARDGPGRDQAAVELMLSVLRRSSEPVVVTVLGSARIVVAAFNREPDLLRRKVKSVVLNAGSAGEDAAEYNVRIDVPSYVGLFRSGLPIEWYPCGAAGPKRSVAMNVSDRNTYWLVSHQELFRDTPQPLFAWFAHAFSGAARGDILRVLGEEHRSPAAFKVREGSRNMWSTASLVLAAGRVLARTSEGWRFIPAGKLRPGMKTQTLTLEPVRVTVYDNGETRWQPAAGSASNVRLFRRDAGPEHQAAMAEALNALLRSLPVEAF